MASMTKLALPLIFAFIVAGIVFMAIISPARNSRCHLTESCSATRPAVAQTDLRRRVSQQKLSSVAPVSVAKTVAKEADDSKLTPVNDSSFEHDVLDYKGVALVDFGATWCGPCKMMLPVVHQLDLGWNGKVKVLKMDVDESPISANRYGVRVVPTFIVFKDGKPVERSTGLTSFEALKTIVQKYL